MYHFQGGKRRVNKKGVKMDRGRGGGGFGGDRPMYDATCSSCGQACQVPFQPKEGRPVYCRECYKKNKKF